MIYTLTLSPAVDLYIFKKYNYCLAGGKGINVSKFLKSLNVYSICLGFVGGNTGKFILNELKKDKIINDFVFINNPTRINMKINIGKETEINGRVLPISKKEYAELKAKLLKLKSNDILIISGSLPKDLNLKWAKNILDILYKRNVNFVFDTSSKLLLKLCRYKPLFVKPNIFELENFFNTKIKTEKQILYYGKKILALGAQNVLISLGPKGAICLNKNKWFKTKAPKVQAISTIGAGDCMVASFLYKFLKTSNVKQSLDFAVAQSSAYVLVEKNQHK